MIAVPEAIIDTLNGLLEAEVNSIFCFVMSGSPYLNEAPADLRKLMEEMHEVCHQHRKDLAALIESLGGVPRVRNRVPAEEQYLSYLSLKFLLPKLVVEKDLLLTRFENAQATICREYPQVIEVLERIETEQRHYLEVLKKSAVVVTHGKFLPPVHKSAE
jgi:methionine aminopeptidase